MKPSIAAGEPLALSADWFRALAETTATAIFVYDLDHFLYVNPAAEQLTGYSAEELLRLLVDDIIVEEQRAPARASRARRIAGDPTPARFELQVRRPDGETRWLLFSAALIRWAGRPAGLGTAIDITETKRAEAALLRQVKLEQAMAEVTRLFLQLPSSELQRGVHHAFSRLAPLVDVDRVQLFLLEGDLAAARRLSRWMRGETEGQALAGDVVVVNEGFDWAIASLRRGEPVKIEDTELLPADASAEALLCRRHGVRAAAVMPLLAGDQLIGFVTFETFHEPRAWTAEVMGLLSILAEVLTAAIGRQRAEAELLRSRERLALAQKAGRSIVWEWNVDDDSMQLPQIVDELFETAPDEIPRSGVELMRLIPKEDQELIHEALRNTLRTGAAYILEHRIVTPLGTTRWLAVRGQLMSDPDARRILGVSTDVTEHRLAEEALLAEQERAQVTLASIGDGVVRTDAEGRVDYMNPVAEQLTGCSLAQALGRPIAEVYRVLDDATGQPRPNPVERCLASGKVVVFPGHSRLQRPDGEEFAVRDSAAPVRDAGGTLRGAVLVVQDVTQLRGLEREMFYLARHDSLTGLINRRELERQLEEALVSARTSDRRHALCYLDLDEFKLVNDTCGHIAGDELLRQLTNLLAAQVREADVIARLGGDEFGVLLFDCPIDGAVAVAEKLCRTVRKFRFTWEGRAFDVGVSIGVVPIAADSGTLSHVLSAADAACYVAKEHGRNGVQLYQPHDHALAARYGEMLWVQRINHGFAEDRFRLYAQPIRPLKEGPEMAEILLRLLDEDGNLLPTPSFIAAAERYHLIRNIDRWVVENALVRIPELPGDRIYAINLSGQSIGDPVFLEFLLDRVRRGRVPPQRLCFEITETATIANLARAKHLILVLKELGCRFVLDDFGSGLSSFAYLQSLPVDFLKIDGEFVRQMHVDPVQRALVESIHHIGHLMGLVTIAESVETGEAHEALRAVGVDYAQGYWLGRPEPL